MSKQAHRPIGARKRQLVRRDPSGLLQRHIGSQAVQIGLGRVAVKHRKGGVPGGGDHAVRSHVVGQIMSKGHEAVSAHRANRAVDSTPHALGVDLPDRAVKAPVFRLHPPQHLTQE